MEFTMNKYFASALCLTLIALALPGCRNRKNETQETVIENDTDTATLLELDKTVFDGNSEEITHIKIKG